MNPTVVMRSYNDMPLIVETLAKLHHQQRDFDLIALDNASEDGTTEELRKYTDRIINVPKGSYVPGRVLNQGMSEASSPFVVFVNSDCTPQNRHWLDMMLNGFSNDKVAAVFGRQIPRPDCHPLFVKDTEDTYGDGSRQKYWRHCFSMASSAIRKSVWEEMPFDEDLQYSEDIDWTWRARQAGYEITYAPESIVMHSHNYTLRQLYKRQYGEGKADACIFEWSPWQRNFLRYSAMPYIRQVISDWKYCLKSGHLGAIGYAPLMRMAHLLGRRKGFNDGWQSLQGPEELSNGGS